MAQTAPAPHVVRIWGHGHRGQDYILTLLTAWQNDFRKLHPEISFTNELDGNASAIGGLFTHTADLAILDREASFLEVDAYEQGAGSKPFGVPIVSGAVDGAHHAPALAVYVHPRNPLAQLSMQQLDAVFDADHRRGSRSMTTWGDLGLGGDWAARPIHLYSNDIQSAEVQFFERAAMKGSQKFNCNLTVFPTKEQVRAALLKDPYGLAVVAGSAAGLKAVALSDGGAAALPTETAITAGSYPLARTVYAYLNRKPGQPVPAELAAFLAYILSPEGQGIAARTGGYLPLPPKLLTQAQEALR